MKIDLEYSEISVIYDLLYVERQRVEKNIKRNKEQLEINNNNKFYKDSLKFNECRLKDIISAENKLGNIIIDYNNN